MSRQSNPTLAIGGEAPYGGESPYGGLSIQQLGGIGGFVMGADLHTPATSSTGWYHERPAVEAPLSMPAMSVPQTEPTPKDPG